MKSFVLNVEIRFVNRINEAIVLENVSATMTVAELMVYVLPRLGLSSDPTCWRLLRQGLVLSPNEKLQSYLPNGGESNSLLQLQLESAESTDGQVWFDLETTDEYAASSLSMEIIDEFGNDDSTEQGGFGGSPSLDHISRDEVQRVHRDSKTDDADNISTVALSRATVRYYKRMNAGRVYPFLVAITPDTIDRIRKMNTDQQASGLFRFNKSNACEIEPIIPGCDCYPRKAVAVIDNDEWIGTFRVVPRIDGKVDGAVLQVRQNHQLLAEVKLEMVVVKRFWYLCFGAMTFVLPAVSTVLKHFGVDFESQGETDFSLYITIARFVFDSLTPLALTFGLGIATVTTWYFSRARTREVFWDIKKLGPDARLAQIRNLMATNKTLAQKELNDLVRTHSSNRPVLLFLAETLYQTKDFQGALSQFQSLMEDGDLNISQYLAASYSAARLGEYQTALAILLKLELGFAPNEVPGIAFYNIGCYHARLGDTSNAIVYLRRAIDTGYNKLQSFAKDEDLDSLRLLPEFQQFLLNPELKIYVHCPSCERELWIEKHEVLKRIHCPHCGSAMSIPELD